MLENLKNPEFIRSIRNDNRYVHIIEFIENYYNENRMDEIPSLSFAERWKVYKDGDRKTGEIPYFARRSFLVGAALMAVLHPENENYITETENILWAICDEYSWVLSAHTTGVLKEDFERIDLFNAETGETVAEICDVLRSRLNPAVIARCEYELRRRIIEPFKNNFHNWEKGISNWSAVCMSGTARVFYYLEPELFREYIPRFKRAMEYFKMSFADDGTCIEGPSYWHYGFGRFVFLAEMIYDFSSGAEDLLQDEKILKMAGYFHRTFLKGDCSVSFSDSPSTVKIGIGLLHYLHKRLPQIVPLLPINKTGYTSPNLQWVPFTYALEFYDPDAVLPEEIEIKDYYLERAGQVILNREKYSFAIKTGCNKEPHNHNDIGSFIFSDKSGQIFCDLGSAKYCNQYFADDTRYKYLCCSSLGHNVPIINGEEQKYGEDCRGTIEYKNGIIKVEFSAAYKIDGVNNLTRTVTPTEDGVVICDECKGAKAFVSRLVTLLEPTLENGLVIVGDTVTEYDAEKCRVSLSVGSHEKGTGEIITVHLIDFEATTDENCMELKIKTQ